MKGKTDATKRAERQILAQDYINAIATLQEAYKSDQNVNNKADIAHNLGYCYEIEGDLELSKKWLTESFTLSGNRKTQNYLDIINNIISVRDKKEK
jgi:tetratricopeptide (TPR) repeat protein